MQLVRNRDNNCFFGLEQIQKQFSRKCFSYKNRFHKHFKQFPPLTVKKKQKTMERIEDENLAKYSFIETLYLPT